MRRYALHMTAALMATVALPGLAAAADAVTSTDLNMRAGPSTEFPVVDVIPDQGEVDVHGCVRQYQWCDVSWRDARGWVSAAYLRYFYQQRYVPLAEYATIVDVPLVTFSFDSYWDNHYRHRSWYQRRAHWHNVWRRGDHHDRAEHRGNRKREAIERRRDRNEDRVGRRKESREMRSDNRRGYRAEQRRRNDRGNKADRRGRDNAKAEHRNRRSAGRPDRSHNRMMQRRANRHDAGRGSNLRRSHGFNPSSRSMHRSGGNNSRSMHRGGGNKGGGHRGHGR